MKMKITTGNIDKVELENCPIFYWVNVHYFEEIGGHGISARVTIDVDYEENMKIDDLEKKAIIKANDFLKNKVVNS
jgi:hypothetical protein